MVPKKKHSSSNLNHEIFEENIENESQSFIGDGRLNSYNGNDVHTLLLNNESLKRKQRPF